MGVTGGSSIRRGAVVIVLVSSMVIGCSGSSDDPATNLAETAPERALELVRAVEQWREAHERSVNAAETEASLEALRNLGYLGDDPGEDED